MNETESRRLKAWSLRCGAASAVLGAAAFLAWPLGLDRLTTLASGWPPVMANTAVLMLACGIALALLAGAGAGAGRGAARLLASAAAALAAATAAEYVLGRDFGIDQLLVRAASSAAARFPGRPSPHTAAAFLFLGTALLLFDGRSAGARKAARVLILISGAIAVVAALGHLFEIGELYGVPAFLPHTGMAMLTVAALLALSAGVLCLNPDEGLMTVVTAEGFGGMAARRLLLGMLALAPLIVLIAVGIRLGWYRASTGAALGIFLAFLEGSAFILQTSRRLIHLEAAQRRHGERLRASEERYRGLVQMASEGIFIADLDGRYTDVNEAGCRMLGYTREELLGKTIADLIPDSEIPRLAQAKELLLSGATQVAEWTLRRKDGVALPVEVSAKIFPDGRWQGFVRDVSERRRVARMKDEVIALASHELQNPLSTVHVAVKMLLSGEAGPLPERAVQMLTLAGAASQRMLGLIRDFLTVEKLETGRLEFNMESVELGRLLQDAVAAVELASGGARRIALEPTGLTVVSDRERLMEVCINLISNALKFSPAGTAVDVRAERRGGRVRVSVRDRGLGIPEEFRGRVFQRFARAAGTTARGSGLGLSISKAIIEGLGGSIGFETEKGKGTTFFFELPGADAGNGGGPRG